MIPAKEKARELVDKYYDFGYLKLDYEQAKQSALIAVNELIKALESDWGFVQVKQDYWQQIKQEIELL